SANTQGSPYTISVDTVQDGYYLAQDSADRFIDEWSSTNSTELLNSVNSLSSRTTPITVNCGNKEIAACGGSILLYDGLTLTNLKLKGDSSYTVPYIKNVNQTYGNQLIVLDTITIDSEFSNNVAISLINPHYGLIGYYATSDKEYTLRHVT